MLKLFSVRSVPELVSHRKRIVDHSVNVIALLGGSLDEARLVKLGKGLSSVEFYLLLEVGLVAYDCYRCTYMRTVINYALDVFWDCVECWSLTLVVNDDEAICLQTVITGRFLGLQTCLFPT